MPAGRFKLRGFAARRIRSRVGGESVFDRLQGSFRLSGIRTAGLRHVRSPAAAGAAKSPSADLHEVDRIKARCEVLGHTDHDGSFAVGFRDKSNDTGSDLFLYVVYKALQLSRRHSFKEAGREADAGDLSGRRGAPASTGRECPAGFAQLSLEPPAILQQLRDARGHFRRRSIEDLRGVLQGALLFD